MLRYVLPQELQIFSEYKLLDVLNLSSELRHRLLLSALLAAITTVLRVDAQAQWNQPGHSVARDSLLSSLLFYVDFDDSFDAELSKGDGEALIEPDRYEPVLTAGSEGKFGEAAQFSYEEQQPTIWTKDVVRYPALGNFPYTKGEAFDGAIGMWLQIDMETLKERSLIWLDPVHLLATRDRNNGKIWMDFVMKELPDTPIFRFGVTAPKDAVRQRETEIDQVIIVPNLNFKGGDWHHVVGTWKNLNHPQGGAVLNLYFDGQLVGKIEHFTHHLDWRIEEWEIRLGLGFKGLIDDFFIFDTFLHKGEISAIYGAGLPLDAWLALKE